MSRFWTLLPHFRGKNAFLERKSLISLGLLCALLLPACGESTPRGYGGSATSSDTLTPIAAPPGADQSPPLPGTTGVPKTADGLPVLGAKGANTALFSTRLDSEVQRLDRLENAVQELRNDFDAMAPAIVRLVAIEKDIQNLVSQLEVLTGGAPAAPVAPIDSALLLEEGEPFQPAAVPLPPTPADAVMAQAAAEDASAVQELPPSAPPAQEVMDVAGSGPPVPEPTPPPPLATPPPQAAPLAVPASPPPAAPATVADVRVGLHPGKVRIVLDVRGKTSFTAELDNQEKILVAELPHAAWTAPAQKSFAGNSVLASYTTEPLPNGGTRLILQLKAQTSLLYKGEMPDAATGGNKIIIDLSAP